MIRNHEAADVVHPLGALVRSLVHVSITEVSPLLHKSTTRYRRLVHVSMLMCIGGQVLCDIHSLHRWWPRCARHINRAIANIGNRISKDQTKRRKKTFKLEHRNIEHRKTAAIQSNNPESRYEHRQIENLISTIEGQNSRTNNR